MRKLIAVVAIVASLGACGFHVEKQEGETVEDFVEFCAKAHGGYQPISQVCYIDGSVGDDTQ